MLDDRKAAILSAVVQEYIETAQPVGSGRVAGAPGSCLRRPVAIHLPPQLFSVFSTATKADWGISTLPTIFIFFLPFFCFSRSLRLRVMSPP